MTGRRQVIEASSSAIVRSMFVFGLMDGLNGAISLVVSLLWAKAATKFIVVAVLARAGGSSVSMGGGEFETDEDSETRLVRVMRALAMMAGYLVSAVMPCAGYLVSRHAGTVSLFPSTAVLLGVIIWARARKHPAWKATAMTTAFFAAAVGAGLAASLYGG